MLLSFAQWIQATGLFTYVRQSAYTYPVILSLHMVAIAFFGGMILMTNLRLLGWAMPGRPISDVVDSLRLPKLFGLCLAVTCGLLMLGSKAEEYYHNPFFRLKLLFFTLLILHHLLFRNSVYRRTAEFDRQAVVPGRAKFAAALSLLLWASVACMGRGIGYIEPPWGISAELRNAPVSTSGRAAVPIDIVAVRTGKR